MADFKKKENIFSLTIWIIACVAGGMLADICVFGNAKHLFENQFIDATVYGYLIIACLLFAGIWVEEEIPKKTKLVLSGGGAILHLIAAILLILFYFDTEDTYGSTSSIRIICGAVLCIANGILYLVIFITGFKKEE